MKKILLFTILFISSAFYSYSQSTDQKYFGQKIWLRGDDSIQNPKNKQSSIEKGKLKTKNANTLTPISDLSFRDSLINFNTSFIFDRTQNEWILPFDTNSNNSQLTVFVVYQSTDTIQEQAIWGLSFQNGQKIMLSTHKLFSPQSIGQFTDETGKYPVINMSSQNWSRNRRKGSEKSEIIIGGSNSDSSKLQHFTGEIAEILVFNRRLSLNEQQKIQSYLGLKYGISLHKQNYISSNNIIYYDTLQNTAYQKGIAGIGRDDEYGLYQKQSQSTTEELFLTISAGELKRSNPENVSHLEDKTFLVWGHNGASLEMESTSSQYPLLARKWVIQPSGSSMRKLSTEVRIYPQDTLDKNSNYVLAIDRTGTGNFDMNGTEYIVSREFTDAGEVIFRNILWDTDLSGKDVFTFSYGIGNTIAITHPSCYNNHNGSIAFKINGGVAPYQYSLTDSNISYFKQWNSKNPKQNIDNLQAGIYTLTVIDAKGNKKISNCKLEQVEKLQLYLQDRYVLDAKKNIIIDVSKEHEDRQLSYQWFKGEEYFSSEHKISVNDTGTYTVHVSDSNNCETILQTKVIDRMTAYVSASEIRTVNSDVSVEMNSRQTNKKDFPQYKILPNPSNGPYTLLVYFPEKASVKVLIFDAKGSSIEEFEGTENTQHKFQGKLNTSGAYMVKILSTYGIESFKMIIE